MSNTLIFRLLTISFLLVILYSVTTTQYYIEEKHPVRYMRDYQLQITQDSIIIMDDLRHVSSISINDDDRLPSIILKDAE